MLSAMIFLHIAAGTLAIAAATIALSARKGRLPHRTAGRVFVSGMLVNAASGAVLGLVDPEHLLITVFAGLLAGYLVITARQTALRRDGRVQPIDVMALAAITASTAGLVGIGMSALNAPDGRAWSFPAEDYFFLALLSGLGAVLDVSFLVRRRLGERQRIARHLWRMCLAFFIAAGSLFTGPGAQIFPQAVRESGLLSLPEAVIFLAMLFWLARTLLRRPRTAETSQ